MKNQERKRKRKNNEKPRKKENTIFFSFTIQHDIYNAFSMTYAENHKKK